MLKKKKVIRYKSTNLPCRNMANYILQFKRIIVLLFLLAGEYPSLNQERSAIKTYSHLLHIFS